MAFMLGMWRTGSRAHWTGILAPGLLALASTVQSQSLERTFAVGGESAVVVNPVSDRVWLSGTNGVTSLNRRTGALTIIPTPAPAGSLWIGLNIETNTLFVSNYTANTASIIDGATHSIVSTSPMTLGYSSWEVDTINNRAYTVHQSLDRLNFFSGQSYQTSAATRSQYPRMAVVNPITRRAYVRHSDGSRNWVMAYDVSGIGTNPPILCPDGSGGFRSIPPSTAGAPDYWIPSCIAANADELVVNPVTNRIYGIERFWGNRACNFLAVIDGASHTSIDVSLPICPKLIAVNPITNKIYLAGGSSVVSVDGVTHAATVLHSDLDGAVAMGINASTNTIYIKGSRYVGGDVGYISVLFAVDGATGVTATLEGIPGYRMSVDPTTNKIYLLGVPSGTNVPSLWEIAGVAGTPTSTGIVTTITPIPGNVSTSNSGSLTLDATSSMTPAPLDTIRKVYYRIGTKGPWSVATGSGPYTATYSGLSRNVPYTLYAFATNGLESSVARYPLGFGESVGSGHVPVFGDVASYTFSTPDPTAPPPPDLSVTQSTNVSPALTGRDVIFTIVATNSGSDDSTGVTLTDTLPASMSFVWASPGCAPSSGVVTCSIGTVPSGGSRSVQIVLRPAATGTHTNSVSISGEQPDESPGNNTSALDVTVDASPAAIAIARYRLYGGHNGEHLFTTDLNEYNTLGSQGWIQEGVTGKLLNNPGSFNGVEAMPYYRLYNRGNTWHHWTTDANEYYTLREFAGLWDAEGVDGFILPSSATGTLQLYRLLYPDGRGLHHWTTDKNECDTLILPPYNWVPEGGSGYLIQ